MARREVELSKSEWGLMEALWDRRRGTARDLQRDLEPTRGWAYSTVKTMLDRLVSKGHVTYRRVGNVYEYFPKVRRTAAIRRVVDDLTDRLLEGSVAPFIQRLIEQRRLTSEEADELRALLEAYGQEKRMKKR